VQEDAGVAIELFGLGQLGLQQVTPRIEEPLQSGLDGFALSQEFFGSQDLVTA